MYEVLLHPDAEKVYADADKVLARKIARCLQQLEQTPRSHPNIKALNGSYVGLRSHIAVKFMNPDRFPFWEATPTPPYPIKRWRSLSERKSMVSDRPEVDRLYFPRTIDR
jgi:hypothetical protein